MPRDHFIDFDIDMAGLSVIIVGKPLPTDNFYVRSYSARTGEKGFADLHVTKSEGLRWLRKTADQFKGMNQPRA